MMEKDEQTIQYIDGYAWGITPGGITICLGTEADIRAILANPKMRPQNPTSAQVILVERQMVKQRQQQIAKEQAKKEVAKKEHRERAKSFGVIPEMAKARVGKNRA